MTVHVPSNGPEPTPGLGMAGCMARVFIDSKLTVLLVVVTVLAGVAATLLLPREEEPQIKVPMVDVLVAMPGGSVPEIEERVSRPMEKLLWEIPGVEYVYSTSQPGQSLVIVRFRVGSDIDSSLLSVTQKLEANFDRIPHGVSQPLVRQHSIDDVPILALTFHGAKTDHLTLRRLVAQLDDDVKRVPDVSETRIIGGNRRALRVLLDPAKLAARGMSVAGIVPMLEQANSQFVAGRMTSGNRELVVETGGFLQTASDVARIAIGVHQGRPVYLSDVAEVVDGAEEPDQYVFHAPGGVKTAPEPAVTLTVAKRAGANATVVAGAVLDRINAMRGLLIPSDIEMTVTRNYGETAKEKSDELLLHMGIAIVGVSLLILLVLGWRESLVVAVAIPSTLGLTLLLFYLYGYTLNRITLFALIFSIGILVDDAIVVVENIVRHMHLERGKGRTLADIIVGAVAEVGNPTILATWAVIAAILPMAFVGGLMGPYMRPIPVGASAAMFFSLLIAFSVTPWAARLMLKGDRRHHDDGTEDWATRLYRRIMQPLIDSARARWAFLAALVVLLAGSCALVVVGWVQVKMLPFDNKSEFQIILNMPEGSSLERTAMVAREMADTVRAEPEVTDCQVYAGTAAPHNFNGLVRHYFMRRGANVADIQVNLLPKHARTSQSHDIAARVRPGVAAIAERYGARVAVAEVPPGPPVLQTLVAEVYAPTLEHRIALATRVRDIFRETPGVVDIDWYLEADQPKVRYRIDREKAALAGISTATVSTTLDIATQGASIDLLHDPREKEDVNLILELPRSLRSHPDDLLALRVRSGDANALPEPGVTAALPLIPLRELVTVERGTEDKSVYHKNLLPVVYVIADVSGDIESPGYAVFAINKKLAAIDARAFGGEDAAVRVFHASQPPDDMQPSVKWDGEWHITLEVFRDLGLAFAAVLILIYLLMVGWFKSFVTPLVVMAAIPFSLVGILPAHGAMDAFFTATSMIGFMAGAGIVVRNSIILVNFIEQRMAEGLPVADAVVDAGAVRFRPMLLTALAVVVGASVILFDPIFQGLALSLMAGEVASLLLSRMAVPVLYFLTAKR